MKTVYRYSLLALSMSWVAQGMILPRDAQSIVSAIQNIQNGTNVVLADINAYQGGTGGVNAAVKIETDANTLNAIIQNGTLTAENSQQLDFTGSAQVAAAVAQLQPSVFSVLTALTNKQELFTAASLGFDAVPLVESALVSQRESTQDLSGNVKEKLSGVLQKVAPLLTTNIDFHFVRAIQAFSSG